MTIKSPTRFVLALAMVATPPAYANDPPSISLVVKWRGADTEALRARIQRELGAPVALAAQCAAPCIDVAIGMGMATVVFTPSRGEARARIIALGADRAQWPVVVTLLVGNIARDEASDVLAGLPAPAAKAAPGPVSDAKPAGKAAPARVSDAKPAGKAAPAAGPAAKGAPAAEPAAKAEPDAESGPVSDAESELAAEAESGPVSDAEPGTASDTESEPTSDTESAPAAVAEAASPTYAPGVSTQTEESHWMLLGLGLTPGLSTDWTHVGTVNHLVAAHLLVGVSGGSGIATASGIVDYQNGNVGGIQLAGIASIADRVYGLQLGGIVAHAGDVDGVQIGGIAAVADNAEAIQLGGIAAVADRASVQISAVATVADEAAALQLAGLAAHAQSSELQVGGIAAHTDDDAGFQLAGVAAVAGRARVQVAGIASASGGDVGIQAAGIASVAETAHFQVAGLVSVADRVEGLQIAPINVAGTVSGVQIGLINIGGEADGLSFGLINIVPGGRYDLEAAVDSSKTSTLLFRHGGHGWHNVYGIAGHPVDEQGPSDDVWMYGLGFGPSWQLESTRVDLEAVGWQVNHGARHSTDVSILAQLRLSIAYGLGPISIVAGGALNAYISDDMTSPLILERRTVMESSRDVTVTKWPSVFLGLRL